MNDTGADTSCGIVEILRIPTPEWSSKQLLFRMSYSIKFIFQSSPPGDFH